MRVSLLVNTRRTRCQGQTWRSPVNNGRTETRCMYPGRAGYSINSLPGNTNSGVWELSKEVTIYGTGSSGKFISHQKHHNGPFTCYIRSEGQGVKFSGKKELLRCTIRRY